MAVSPPHRRLRFRSVLLLLLVLLLCLLCAVRAATGTGDGGKPKSSSKRKKSGKGKSKSKIRIDGEAPQTIQPTGADGQQERLYKEHDVQGKSEGMLMPAPSASPEPPDNSGVLLVTLLDGSLNAVDSKVMNAFTPLFAFGSWCRCPQLK